MKKSACILLIILIAGIASAQADSAQLPTYKRFPTVPPFKILQVDSVTYFAKADLKKNRPVLVMLFSPDCDHCKHETEEIIRHIEEFKQVQIVMATTMPFTKMKEFYSHYELKKYKNIKVGQDYQYLLPTFYMISNLPYLAMYDKEGKLITTSSGSMKIEDLVKVFK